MKKPKRNPNDWQSRIIGEGEEAPDQLLANALNPRIHPKAQQDAIKGSLESLGWIQRIIVNQRTGYVVDGHARIAQAISAGQATVPVVYVDLSEEEERLALAILDKSAEMAGSDPEIVAQLLDSVSTEDSAIQSLLDSIAKDAGVDLLPQSGDLDDIPEPPVEPTTQVGDLWRLGDHRLLCGDSTVVTDVERLMGGEILGAVVTDTPYGIGFNYEGHDDGREGWFPLMNAVVPMMRAIAPFVVMPSCGLDRLGWWYDHHPPDWLIAWYKGSPGHQSPIGFNDWEAHLVWGTPPERTVHDHFQTECGFDSSLQHPCPKPVAWGEWLIERSAVRGASVLDPFLGSGTTMIAAERLGRRCYGMEISPAYCDVVIKRFEDMTGQTAELVRVD